MDNKSVSSVLSLVVCVCVLMDSFLQPTNIDHLIHTRHCTRYLHRLRKQLQLASEHHGFELFGSTYNVDFFSINTVSVFSHDFNTFL